MNKDEAKLPLIIAKILVDFRDKVCRLKHLF